MSDETKREAWSNAHRWQIYDQLVDLVPPDLVVEDCLAGFFWTLVRSRGVGVAMTLREGHLSASGAGSLVGMRVRQLAERIKSWNFLDASFGLAAINSYLNAPEEVQRRFHLPETTPKQANVFDVMADQLRGKKVAVVGHFRRIEHLADICELTIIERRCSGGDIPDPAAEYILPSQDWIVITATTLINKTLPRLLELGKNARVTLVGPSAPLTPLLFQHGVDVIAGLIVRSPEKVWRRIAEGGNHDFGGNEIERVILTPESVKQ